MSYPIETPDDGSPRAALDIAGQAVRAFHHRAGRRFVNDLNGWNHVPDVYRCIGELTYLIGMLPQVFDTMVAAMRAQLDAGHVAMDAGSAYDGQPTMAIDEACAALTAAVATVKATNAGLARAQTAINAASYTGPEIRDRRRPLGF